MNKDKEEYLSLIKSNIGTYGYHVTVVKSEAQPRYAYTIGLKDLFGYELIFAGGVYYMQEELFEIFKGLVDGLKTIPDLIKEKVSLANLGAFSFSNTHSSWSGLMLLGVFDYFSIDNINALQVIPDADHYTQDIPDMSKAFDQSTEPIWQWLTRNWDYNVPVKSTVVTNIDSLRGHAITELMRWENDDWEMFAGSGPDIDKKDIRVVPLATMLGIDNSLMPAISLENGKGLWREDDNSEWNNWG